MIYNEALLLAQTVLQADLDLIVFGPQGCGKTALCQELAADAPLLHAVELKSENLTLLRSQVANAPAVIIENADTATLQFLKPFLSTRSVLGARFDCRFLITAAEELSLEGVAKIRLAPLEATGWLAWAQKNRIHPALRLLVENDERILTRHNPRTLEALSRLLSAKPSNKSLRAAIESLLGSDEIALAALLSAMSEPAPAAVNNDESFLIEKARTGTRENVDRFEHELIEELKNNPNKEKTHRLIHYLQEVTPGEAVRILTPLIDNAKAQESLGAALADPKIRALIDAALREFL